MPELFYKIVLGALVVCAGVIRAFFEFRYQRIEHLKSYEEKRERRNALLAGVCFTLPGTLWLFTGWLSFASLELDHSTRLAGCVLMLFNQLFFLRIHLELGENWSPILEIRRGQQLITTGPYRYIRHPMYTCIFIHLLSLLFVSANWVVGGTGLLSFAVIYAARVKSEEQMMLDTFGDKYLRYMRQTGRLLPKLF